VRTCHSSIRAPKICHFAESPANLTSSDGVCSCSPPLGCRPQSGEFRARAAGEEFAGDSHPCLANFLQDGIGSWPAAFQSRPERRQQGRLTRTNLRIESMRHILTGAAVVAAIVFSTPSWAQPTSPGGNAMGMPGPNPGGPGLTPYTTPPGQAARPYTPPPTTAAPPASTPPYATNESPPATPPSYPSRRHARTYHGRTGSHPGRGYSAADNSADQLNQSELGKLQAAGNYSNPPTSGYRPPPQPGYAPPPGYPPPRPGYAPPPGYPPPMQPGYPMGTTGGGAPYRP
jgi:hypothetical protein